MRRGQASHADKSLKRPAREARSGRKALLPRRLVAEATMLPLNIELLPFLFLQGIDNWDFFKNHVFNFTCLFPIM